MGAVSSLSPCGLAVGSATAMPGKPEAGESLLPPGPCTDSGVSGLHGSLLTPSPPSLQQEDQEEEGFPTKHSCRSKPCAPSEAPVAPCGKRGDNALEIEIYFSVFSET